MHSNLFVTLPAAVALRDRGTLPPGMDPASFRIRPASVLLPTEVPWVEGGSGTTCGAPDLANVTGVGDPQGPTAHRSFLVVCDTRVAPWGTRGRSRNVLVCVVGCSW
jgi:hypothetical protein